MLDIAQTGSLEVACGLVGEARSPAHPAHMLESFGTMLQAECSPESRRLKTITSAGVPGTATADAASSVGGTTAGVAKRFGSAKQTASSGEVLEQRSASTTKTCSAGASPSKVENGLGEQCGADGDDAGDRQHDLANMDGDAEVKQATDGHRMKQGANVLVDASALTGVGPATLNKLSSAEDGRLSRAETRVRNDAAKETRGAGMSTTPDLPVADASAAPGVVPAPTAALPLTVPVSQPLSQAEGEERRTAENTTATGVGAVTVRARRATSAESVSARGSHTIEGRGQEIETAKLAQGGPTRDDSDARAVATRTAAVAVPEAAMQVPAHASAIASSAQAHSGVNLATDRQESAVAEASPAMLSVAAGREPSSTYAAEGAAMLRNTATTLEVGVPGGTHGWLRIHAEMTDSGAVNAQLTAATPAAQAALHRELPALHAYLDQQQVALSTVTVHTAALSGSEADTSSLGASSSGSGGGGADTTSGDPHTMRERRQSTTETPDVYAGGADFIPHDQGIRALGDVLSGANSRFGGWVSVRV